MKFQLAVALVLIPSLSFAQGPEQEVDLPNSLNGESQIELSTGSLTVKSKIEDMVLQRTGMDLSEQEHIVEFKEKEVVVKVRNPFNGKIETMRLAREVSCC